MSFDLSDTDLLLRCMVDATVDPSCACMLSGGGPELNTDISGPGVRISFYLQALFLALMASRSGSLEEIQAGLYTLIVSNISMAITTLILGFKSQPGMSFHDAIVVFYLLAGSWISIFFSLPSYNRYAKGDKALSVLSIIHSYIVFAFIAAILITAPTFGSTPRCNKHAVAVIFTHFPAINAGRITAFAFLGVAACVYSVLSVCDYYKGMMEWYHAYRRRQRRQRRKEEKLKQAATTMEGFCGAVGTDTLIVSGTRSCNVSRDLAVPGPSSLTVISPDKAKVRWERADPGMQYRPPEKKKRTVKERAYLKKKREEEKTIIRNIEHYVPRIYQTGIFGSLLIEIVIIGFVWTLFVMNTELLILWNRFDGGGDGLSADFWGFGQILPMFLVILPFVQLCQTYYKLKMKKRHHRRHRHMSEADDEGKTIGDIIAVVGRRFVENHGFNPSYGRNHSHTSHDFFGRTFRQERDGWQNQREPRPAPFAFPAFQTRGDTRNNHPYGGQPSARISLNSIHSEKTDINTAREGRGHGKKSEVDAISINSVYHLPAASLQSGLP